ncbi:MAG: cation transporter [Planctomycetes bacterium]|nr:cation transporter [Planctomycetota bacterium]
MQSALEKVDGVDGVTVDYASKTATVTGTGLDKAALVGAFEGHRKFSATVKE